MDFALLCLLVLLAVLLASCLTSSNVGLAAIGAAWILGVHVAPRFDVAYDAKRLLAAFPADLFLTLAGTTLLFAAAQTNGTLEQVVSAALRHVGGRSGWMPVAFFLLTLVVSASGAGSIAATALLAPSAMAVAARTGISPLVMTLAVAHGAVAGGLSPISLTGIVMVKKLDEIGLADSAWSIAGFNMVVGAVVAAVGCVVLGRWNATRRESHSLAVGEASADHDAPRWQARHVATVAMIVIVFGGAILFRLELGFTAVTGAALLFLSGTADERRSFAAVPWSVLLMVCGVSMLVKLCETAGSLDLLARQLAVVSSADTIDAWSALTAGGISIFSSTSSAVLPTFLPMVPKIAGELGSVDQGSLAEAIVVGSNLVDVSPLSTIGALCVAAAPPHTNVKRLFNQTLIWGAAMAPVAALIALLR